MYSVVSNENWHFTTNNRTAYAWYPGNVLCDAEKLNFFSWTTPSVLYQWDISFWLSIKWFHIYFKDNSQTRICNGVASSFPSKPFWTEIFYAVQGIKCLTSLYHIYTRYMDEPLGILQQSSARNKYREKNWIILTGWRLRLNFLPEKPVANRNPIRPSTFIISLWKFRLK